MRQLRPETREFIAKSYNFESDCICFVSWFIILLNISKWLSEVGYFVIKWICWPMRQIQPATGEYLVFFFKILIQLYLLRSLLYSVAYFIKEVTKGRIFWRLNLKVPVYEAATAWNRGITCNFFKTLIELYFIYLFLYFWLTVSKRVT